MSLEPKNFDPRQYMISTAFELQYKRDLMLENVELHQVQIKKELDAYERYVLWLSPDTLKKLSTEISPLGRCMDPSRAGYGNQLRLSSGCTGRVRHILEKLHPISDIHLNLFDRLSQRTNPVQMLNQHNLKQDNRIYACPLSLQYSSFTKS